jgi:hypothetical protein
VTAISRDHFLSTNEKLRHRLHSQNKESNLDPPITFTLEQIKVQSRSSCPASVQIHDRELLDVHVPGWLVVLAAPGSADSPLLFDMLPLFGVLADIGGRIIY